MGILSRFGEIMSANVNSWLDGLEAKNAEKLIDERLRQTRQQLSEVKKETQSVMANETNAKRMLDKALGEVQQYETAALNAVKAGNEDDARKLLATKQEKQAVVDGLQKNYDQAHKNAENMRAMYNKLTADISAMESRADMIKGKLATAKAQEAVNKMTAAAGAAASMASFDRMEAAADKRLDEAVAGAQLDKEASAGDSLLQQYSSGASASVEDELARLKAQLGQL